MGRQAGVRVDGEAFLNEVAGGEGDAAPVFERGEGVVGDEDGLHFFEVGVPVEGRVAAEEEVGDYADGPDVAGEECQFVFGLFVGGAWMVGREGMGSLHWFPVSGLLEYLGGHVARCAACCSEDVECFFVHYPRQAEVGN